MHFGTVDEVLITPRLVHNGRLFGKTVDFFLKSGISEIKLISLVRLGKGISVIFAKPEKFLFLLRVIWVGLNNAQFHIKSSNLIFILFKMSRQQLHVLACEGFGEFLNAAEINHTQAAFFHKEKVSGVCVSMDKIPLFYLVMKEIP